MRRRILDIDLGLAVRRDTKNPGRFIAADEEVARNVESNPIRQPPEIAREDTPADGRAVLADRNSGDPAGEGLAYEERITGRSKRHPVSKGHRLAVPHSALPIFKIISPNAGTGAHEIVAVRDEKATTARIDDWKVR